MAHVRSGSMTLREESGGREGGGGGAGWWAIFDTFITQQHQTAVLLSLWIYKSTPNQMVVMMGSVR